MFSLDPAVLQPSSAAHQRQEGYYRGHALTVGVLASGSMTPLQKGEHEYIPFGGSKLQSFWSAVGFTLRLQPHQFDLVTCQDALFTGICGYFAMRRLRARLVIQLHGDYLDNPLWIHQRPLNRLLNVIGKQLLLRADGVRCVSQRIMKQVVEGFHISAERVVSMPICTDLGRFSSFGSRKPGGPYVIFVGRLIEEKLPLLFCDVVIPLLSTRPRLHAVVAGTGHLQAAMEKSFAEAGVGERVLFTGQIGQEELAAWYRSSVCYIHTASWEGWGMPMIEAMACGCPVVTTDSGCAGEAVIDGHNGFVVPVEDAEGLRERVRCLLDDPALQQRLAANALQDAQAWSFDVRVKDQIHWYERILRTSHSRDGSGRSGGY